MRIRVLILASITLLLTPLVASAQSSIAVQAISEAEQEALFPSRDVIEFGRTVTESNCAGCHGMDGLSDTEGMPQLAGQRTVYLYRVCLLYTSDAADDRRGV